MRRVHGIKVLHCSSGSPPRYRDPALAAVEVQRKGHIAYRVITRLPALLCPDPEAEIHLDLHFGELRHMLPESQSPSDNPLLTAIKLLA